MPIEIYTAFYEILERMYFVGVVFMNVGYYQNSRYEKESHQDEELF
jgi:hypothetical protein